MILCSFPIVTNICHTNFAIFDILCHWQTIRHPMMTPQHTLGSNDTNSNPPVTSDPSNPVGPPDDAIYDTPDDADSTTLVINATLQWRAHSVTRGAACEMSRHCGRRWFTASESFTHLHAPKENINVHCVLWPRERSKAFSRCC